MFQGIRRYTAMNAASKDEAVANEAHRRHEIAPPMNLMDG